MPATRPKSEHHRGLLGKPVHWSRIAGEPILDLRRRDELRRLEDGQTMAMQAHGGVEQLGFVCNTHGPEDFPEIEVTHFRQGTLRDMPEYAPVKKKITAPLNLMTFVSARRATIRPEE